MTARELCHRLRLALARLVAGERLRELDAFERGWLAGYDQATERWNHQ
jgi:hypothetical protein